MFTFIRAIPVIPGGSLQPTQLQIVGNFSCPNGANADIPLELQFTSPNSAPSTIFTATTSNGSTGPVGSVTFIIPAWQGLRCGEKVAFNVRGNCSGTLTSWQSIGSFALDCSGCPRIALDPPVYGACTGSPPKQDVTLTATVMLEPNQTETLFWEFGDGSSAPAGTITNTSGSPNQPFNLTITHAYDDRPQGYLVCLRSTNNECQRACITAQTQCGSSCPVVTATASVGACDAAGTREVTYDIQFNPPLPQGASATVVLAYGGTNFVNQNSAVINVNASTNSVNSQQHITRLPATGLQYSGSVTVVFNIPGVQCPATPVTINVTPLTCTPCPTITVAVNEPMGNGWCAPVQGLSAIATVTINWPPGVSNPPVPIRFDWSVNLPDGRTASQQSIIPSVSTAVGWFGSGALSGAVDLTNQGSYGVGITVVFPATSGLTQCNLTGSDAFTLAACPGTAENCPTLGALQITPSCADPSQNRSATVTVSVAVNDPSGLASSFVWDFGDGTVVTTNAPTTTHTYTSTGTFTVTVLVQSQIPCVQSGPAQASTSVTIPLCACPDGQTRADGRCVTTDNEGTGCQIARIIAAVLFALAILALLLGLCIQQLQPAIFYVALGLAIAGVIVLVIWLVLCPTKPCWWALLLFGQIFLTVGWIAINFGWGAQPPCCAWLGGVGIGLLILGAGLIASWAALCRVGQCRLLRELSIPLTAVAIPAIAYIALVPGASNCVNSIVAAIMATAYGVLVTAALTCRGE